MKQIGVKEARERLRELLEQVEHGETVVITRQGRAVAQLTRPRKVTKELPSLGEFRRSLGTRGTPAARLLREERDLR